MAKYANSFSLLDDEEEDDVTTLVGRLVKKVDESLLNVHKDKESLNFVLNESSQSGSQDGHYSRDGSWGAIEDGGHWQDEGGETGVNCNESTGFDQFFKENDGWQDVPRSNGKGHANNGSSLGDGQLKNYRNENWSHGGRRGDGEQFYANDVVDGQKRRYINGNRDNGGVRRGNGDRQAQSNHGGDGQSRYRNGNQGYGGDRRGNGDHRAPGNDGGERMRYRNGNRGYGGYKGGQSDQQVQDGGGADGQKRYRNGNHGGYGGGRQGYYRDRVQDNDTSSGQQNGEGDVFEDDNSGGEERTYRNRNLNYSGERRGRGGYRGSNRGRGRGRGRFEFRRTGSDEGKDTGYADDGHDVNSEHIKGSGGDAITVLNASAAAAEEEKNASEVINGDVRDPKEQKKSEELKLKNKEIEEAKRMKTEKGEKEAALMTLDQYYEKLHSKKSQLVELKLQKSEAKRVALDKDFERMQVFERKPEDIDNRWFSIRKLKTKESLKRQVSESSKTVDYEGNDSGDVKLKTEEIPQITDNLKKEKGREVVVLKAHETFTSAYSPRRFGGLGSGGKQGGWCAGGDQGDHRDGGYGRRRGEQIRLKDRNNEGAPQTYSDAPALRRHRAPLSCPEDFPVLVPVRSAVPFSCVSKA